MLALAAVLLLAQEGGATVSFSGPHLATHPGTIEGDEVLRVQIRALPRSLDVWRAVLHVGRDEGAAFADRARELLVTHARDGREVPLALRPPALDSLDATEALRHALADGRTEVVFSVRSFAGFRPLLTRLDVTGAMRPKQELPRVTGLRAVHADGRTFLTWSEVEREAGAQRIAVSEFLRWREALVVRSRRVRYRAYRSDEPVTPASIRSAELIAELAPLSAWNLNVLGTSPANDETVPRYVLRDGDPPVPPSSELHVVEVAAPRRSFYAVSAAIDGEEDLSVFDDGNRSGLVVETPGAGAPVLQERLDGPFLGVDGAAVHRYVRWEGGRAHDYLVAVPPGAQGPSPAGLHLHGWGGRLDRGLGAWQGAAQGAVLVSSVMSPYDGWTGVHERLGTWRPWTGGAVRPVTQDRILAFLDWACDRHGLDRSRLFAAGPGLGGGGAALLGVDHPGRFAWTMSSSGVHRPAKSPVYGPMFDRVWDVPERNPAPFLRWDLARREDPVRPLLVFSSARNDRAGAWAEALEVLAALQEARQPHVFSWGRQGERQPAAPPGTAAEGWALLGALRSGSSLPAFTKGSLDDDPRAGDGDGRVNGHLLWDPAVVDEAGRWEARLRVSEGAPAGEAVADVTPRRCARFRPAAGEAVAWTLLSAAGEELASGKTSGPVPTVPRVRIVRGGVRLVLAR